MKEINGQFIMDGCAPDDPNRLDTPEQLLELLRAVGFLPLFANAIPGFSVEEHVPADHWWTDEEKDPWAWRQMLADHPEIAYGKFFNRKAGFLHKDWFPVFASYRRNGYDFDALCDDELAPYKWKNAMEQFFLNEQSVGKVLPASDVKEEAVKTDLQMRTYLINMGFTQKRNKNGQPYGWYLATLGTPETKWGYDFVTSRYFMSPQECWQTTRAHMIKLYPSASDDALWSLLGMRILASDEPKKVKPSKPQKPKTMRTSKIYPGNLIAKIDRNIPLPLSEDQLAGLQYAISTLLVGEQNILKMHFEEDQTFMAIGVSYGIAGSRIQQIVKRAIRKLHHPSRFKYIMDGLNQTNAQRESMKRAGAFSDFPVASLGLSARTINALLSGKMDTVEKVCDAMANNPEHIRCLPGFVIGSAQELINALMNHGVEFDCPLDDAVTLLWSGNNVPILGKGTLLPQGSHLTPDSDISALDMSVRAFNILWRNGVRSIRDLINLTGEEHFTRAGPKAWSEIHNLQEIALEKLYGRNKAEEYKKPIIEEIQSLTDRQISPRMIEDAKHLNLESEKCD